MFAGNSSPPPPETDLIVSIKAPISATPVPGAAISAVTNTKLNVNSTISRSSVPPGAQNRKRKRGQVASTPHAASPAPSEPGSTAGNTAENDSLLVSRGDLYSRPILTISRGPTFIPTAEGSEWYRTESVGVNRVGFRYVPAGINQPGFITPCRTIESSPTSFRISWEDRSPLIRVSKDGLSLLGFKGFRSARCNAPIREGKWYIEVKVINGGGDFSSEQPDSSKQKEGGHIRIGWGRREASLNGPVGLDGYSYAYRDKTGDKVTLSRPRPYGKPFKSGDVVGMYISLPPLRQPNKKDPHDPAHIHRERIPIDLKGQEVFEILEYPVSKEMAAMMDYSGKTNTSASVPSANNKKPAAAGVKPPERTNGQTDAKAKSNDPPLRPLPTLPNSRIAFFVNGESQGIAFEDLYDFLPLRQTEEQKRKAKDRSRRVKEGVKEHRENPFDDGTLGYYPMISLFNDAIVQINPGPNFDYAPPPDIDALLEGRPQPEPIIPEIPQQPLESKSADQEPMEVDTQVKSEPEAVSLDVKMDVDSEAKVSPEEKPAEASNKTWRPAIERYPEFMKEQWTLDDIEEQEAKTEFNKQVANQDSGKGAAKKKAAPRAKSGPQAVSAGGKKKKSETSTTTGTPEPSASLVPPSRKKTKKAAAQAALGVAAPSQPTPDVVRSTTETPFSTPPPPVSSTAAAAAAAAAHLHLQHQHQHPPNPHQFHHSLVRSESNSNRPSPSPLRQSTAYREQPPKANDGGENDDSGERLTSSTSLSAQHRVKKHPGSREGRFHAQQAAAAAAAISTVKPVSVSSHPPSSKADRSVSRTSTSNHSDVSAELWEAAGAGQARVLSTGYRDRDDSSNEAATPAPDDDAPSLDADSRSLREEDVAEESTPEDDLGEDDMEEEEEMEMGVPLGGDAEYATTDGDDNEMDLAGEETDGVDDGEVGIEVEPHTSEEGTRTHSPA